jgi:AcrR family transcriptional regulator
MPELPPRVRWEDVAMAAARQIREEGIARLDLGGIAANLEVAPEAVTYWFGDETEVLISVMQIRQRWFLDQADTRLAHLPTYAERLKALIDLCVADYDVTYWIELWKLGLRDGRARAARQTLRGAYRDLFARLIRGGQRSGEFAQVSPDQVALVLVSLVVGLSVEVTVSDPSRAENMETVLTEASERLLEVELSTSP